MNVVVMGVSGCGKTTIGQLLAVHLSLPFYDADEFHPAENVRKMKSGVPLTDADREPWLKELACILREEEKDKGCILACSALKESYRLILQKDLKGTIFWVYLEGTQDLIHERLKNRPGHFMDERLLSSQFETLEKPAYALSVPVDMSPEEIVAMISEKLEEK